MSIELLHVTKQFGNQKALNNISFSVKAGEIAGFIGPNGAGKSTTMKIICGLLYPDNGSVLINQKQITENSSEARRFLGYLPETNPLYPEMYVIEYLSYVAGLYKLGGKSKERIKDIISMTGLETEKKKKIGSLSKGYRQRVGIAQTLLHDPSVLILDEPTSGLDPNQIIEIRNLIKETGRNKTILLSTHIMQEVEAICDRVIIINKGEIVADTDTRHIQNAEKEKYQTILVEFNNNLSDEEMKKIAGAEEIRKLKDKTWLIQSYADNDIRPEIFNFAVKHNLTILSLHKKEKKLEDVFRELTS